uniref:Uncharacterized protein n=1 Tax=Kalanchoe fedtschenkoi TaxID=63787 RepID=A0A7N0TBK1_KALFE
MADTQQSSIPRQVELVIIDPSPSTPSHDPSSRQSPLLFFLSNFHASYFRISLSLCGQALLWKSMGGQQENAAILRRLVPSTASVFIWSFALLSLVSLSFLYMLRCVFHFDKVKAEFSHSVGVNYMFVPWISCLFLIQSCPFMEPAASVAYSVLWWIFVIPVVILDVKIYGQWFTKGKRYLSGVANPTCLLSVIANFAGAWAAADMENMESGLFMFALGAAHYVVLFVTLYQGGYEGWIGASLKPVFFLSFAAPSMASLTWHSLGHYSSFDCLSKLLFFLSVFLCISLVCRGSMFKKSMRRYSIAWWAYSFPLTVLAMDSAEYAHQVKGVVPHALMLFFSTLSFLVNLLLIIYMTLNMKSRRLVSLAK